MNMKGKILKKNEWVQILYDWTWEENRLEPGGRMDHFFSNWCV